jgi:hypothetical protein
MSLVIKLQINGTLRRVSVPSNETLTFAKLSALAKELEPSLAGVSANALSFVWEDDEGDRILVSSDRELSEAVKVMSSDCAALRFTVQQFTAPEVTAPTKQVDSVGVIHPNVICDGCGKQPIEGIRYHCSVRDDFDLCEDCEATQPQPFPLLKIVHNRPVGPGPWGRGRGRGRGRGGRGGLFPGCPPHHAFPPFHHGPQPHPHDHHPHPPHHLRRPPSPPHERVPREPSRFLQALDRLWTGNIPAATTVHADEESVEEVDLELSRAVESSLSSVDHCRLHVNTPPSMQFVRDVTYPDKSTVRPGETFLKLWRVRNDGLSLWPDSCMLVPIGGDLLTSTGLRVGLPVLLPGQEVDVAVSLTAPLTEGLYTVYFRAQTKDEQCFGHRLWASIVVEAPELEPVTEIAEVVSSFNAVNLSTATNASNASSVSLGEWAPVVVNLDEVEEKEVEVVVSCAISPSQGSLGEDWTPVTNPDNDLNDGSHHHDHDIIDNNLSKPAMLLSSDLPVTQSLSMSVSGLTTSNVDRVNSADIQALTHLWRRELSALNEMGFTDEAEIVPLLLLHLKTPMTLSGFAVPDPHGMQQVVTALLSN